MTLLGAWGNVEESAIFPPNRGLPSAWGHSCRISQKEGSDIQNPNASKFHVDMNAFPNLKDKIANTFV